MKITVYGIPNCDSCKNAIKWLNERNISHTFVNFKETPPKADQLANWLNHIPANTLLNKRSTAWRQLDEAQKSQIETTLLDLLIAYPNLIKRPVIETAETAYAGFKAEQYTQIFKED